MNHMNQDEGIRGDAQFYDPSFLINMPQTSNTRCVDPRELQISTSTPSRNFGTDNTSEQHGARKSYAQYIYEALESTEPLYEMSLQQIYTYYQREVVSRGMGCTDDRTAWRGSIRYNLCRNEDFIHIRGDHTAQQRAVYRLSDAAIRRGGVEPTTRYRQNTSTSTSSRRSSRRSASSPRQASGNGQQHSTRTAPRDGQDHRPRNQVFRDATPTSNELTPVISNGALPYYGYAAGFSNYTQSWPHMNLAPNGLRINGLDPFLPQHIMPGSLYPPISQLPLGLPLLDNAMPTLYPPGSQLMDLANSDVAGMIDEFNMSMFPPLLAPKTKRCTSRTKARTVSVSNSALVERT